MRRSSLIGHVTELYAAVSASRHPADSVTREFFRSRHYLGAKDRRFIAETLYGMLRHFRLIGALLEGSVDHPISRYAAYAHRVLGEPADAVALEIGPLWSTFIREGDAATFLGEIRQREPVASLSSDPVRAIGLRHSFPDVMVEEWVSRLGVDGTERLCQAMNRQAPTVIRVNMLKCTPGECAARLASEGVECSPSALSPTGLILSKRVNLQGLRSHQDGWFELQDEGSQLISILLGPAPGETIVDACAGGGGKALHIAALLGNSGTVIAMDQDRQRLGDIDERVRRAGATCLRVVNRHEHPGVPSSLDGKADRVLVDAPCSGTGTYRRNPGAKSEFRESRIAVLARAQQEILLASARMVRPGGSLVYSTCSLLRIENEDVITAFLSRVPGYRLESATAHLRRQGIETGIEGEFLTLFPHLHGTDGFFAALLRRYAV